ncbi:malonic semialdehyde reductase [Sphingomonas donggukensis]|uniref:Malonic semialdehyde reductase n=1 Tax=Sphingomonas donggukensis TaxID=2949093 RepID=A0ABY4TRX7_9SPHN|nr:malonic semialdehyde reductase [Sphingomonas donggukensis]URW75149.1 malonic semialdehyde reductase [Sphingomonas donggukensis]
MAENLSEAGLDTIFRTARTANTYRPDSVVTHDDIRAIYDLVKMGPTSANMQPARFVWLTDAAGKARLAAHASGSNAEKIKAAPAAVIVAMDTNFHEQLPWLFPHDPTAKHWFPDAAAREIAALRNSSLQGAYLIVAARALGFDVGPMSGFDQGALDADFFAATPAVKSNFVATIGHADPASIFDRSPRPDFETFNTFA